VRRRLVAVDGQALACSALYVAAVMYHLTVGVSQLTSVISTPAIVHITPVRYVAVYDEMTVIVRSRDTAFTV